jgi:hypothetical protein
MAGKINKRGTPSQPNGRGMSIVPVNGGNTDHSLLPKDGVTESMYSGYEPNLVSANQEIYYLKPIVRARPRCPVCTPLSSCSTNSSQRDCLLGGLNSGRNPHGA